MASDKKYKKRMNRKTNRKIKNRFNRTRKQKMVIKPKIKVVGKIYSNGCIHCQMLEPEWNKMKQEITSDAFNNRRVVFVEIEQANQDAEIADTNNKYLINSSNKLALQEGYPTIFRIENGKIDYYNGQRDANTMRHWFLV
jgi:thiol-disulfide isomerase/thioredoxin